MADRQPETNIDLSAVIAPHLGAPGRGLEGDAETLRQNIFNQRIAAERQAMSTTAAAADARTIREQSLALRRADSRGIKTWHVVSAAVLVAGGIVAGRYILNQPAQAEQLPIAPTPVSTQTEQGGILDNIPGFSDIADAFGDGRNGSAAGK